jgi:hypothetical protein
MPVPNIFASATSAIPLSQLDQNFATAITLGNTAVYLGNTTTSLGNVTLTNVTISSGNVTVSAGSNTSPSITTVGDTNTGIFFPAADTIAFSTNGAERARIDSSGNMGLGVTPAAWGGVFPPAFQLRGAALSSQSNANITHLTQNVFFNSSSSPVYIASDFATRYTQYQGQHQWYTAASGTVGGAISWTQAMNVNANGALALQGASTSADGIGITFPATQSASTDVNTLDDYEEGTWSPTILWNGDSTGATYSFQVGTYTKIGNVVYFQAYVQIATQSSATGNLTVGGLPFTSRNTSNLLTLCHAAIDNASTNITQPKGRIDANATSVTILSGADTNNWSAVTNTIRAASFRVYVAGHYYI